MSIASALATRSLPRLIGLDQEIKIHRFNSRMQIAFWYDFAKTKRKLPLAAAMALSEKLPG